MRLRRGVRGYLAPALRALAAHRLRAGLAISAVAAGTAAVLLTGAIGAGAGGEVAQRMESMGTNLLVVRPVEVGQRVARRTMRGAVTTLEPGDGEAIARLRGLAAAPSTEGRARVEAGRVTVVSTVRGTVPVFLAVRGFRLAEGRFFDAGDEQSARRVAVLGARVADALFAGEPVVGADIRVRGIPFEVIGVLRSKGALAGGDEDDQVLVPLRTGLRRLLSRRWLDAVYVSVEDPRRMEEAMAEIRELLRARHRAVAAGGREDFEVQNAARALAVQRQAIASLTLLTTGLGALALGVGGIGIFALLLIAVRERTTEIGLRMAVGARPRDVLLQFLCEASFLAVGGWVAGVGLGALGAATVALGSSWKLGLPVAPLFASLGMAVLVGLGCGAYPARQASRLPPVDALRAA